MILVLCIGFEPHSLPGLPIRRYRLLYPFELTQREREEGIEPSITSASPTEGNSQPCYHYTTQA